VEQDLESVVLLVLDWVEAEVKLRQQRQLFDIFELQHFLDSVQGQIQEAEGLDHLEALQFSDLIFRQVKGAQNSQQLQACDFLDLVICKVELLEHQGVQVFDLLNLVGAKGEHAQGSVFTDTFDKLDIVLVEVQVLQVLVPCHIFNPLYLVEGQVDPLKVGRGVEVEHLRQVVVRGVQLNQMLQSREVTKMCQVVSLDVDCLQESELLDTLDSGEVRLDDVELEVCVSRVVESLPEA